ncbi:MAG: ferritin [Actinomycetota bacterium]
MFSERLHEGFNDQLMREIGAFYTYLAMSEYCDALSWPGFTAWFERQSQEEWMHAMKFRSFIQDRSGRVRYQQIRAPESEFDSMLEVFERTLENERSVTQSIGDLYALAVEEKDFASQAFLNWFVTEQVEEEKTVGDMIDWLRRIGDSQQGLYLLDQQLLSGIPAGGGAEGPAQA